MTGPLSRLHLSLALVLPVPSTVLHCGILPHSPKILASHLVQLVRPVCRSLPFTVLLSVCPELVPINSPTRLFI